MMVTPPGAMVAIHVVARARFLQEHTNPIVGILIMHMTRITTAVIIVLMVIMRTVVTILHRMEKTGSVIIRVRGHVHLTSTMYRPHPVHDGLYIVQKNRVGLMVSGTLHTVGKQHQVVEVIMLVNGVQQASNGAVLVHNHDLASGVRIENLGLRIRILTHVL